MLMIPIYFNQAHFIGEETKAKNISFQITEVITGGFS
jgi:hypothetical protein